MDRSYYSSQLLLALELIVCVLRLIIYLLRPQFPSL